MAAAETPRDQKFDDDKMNLLQINLERERSIKRLKDQDSKANAAQIADLLAAYELNFFFHILCDVYVHYELCDAL